MKNMQNSRDRSTHFDWLRPGTIALSHRVVEQALVLGDSAVDATVGNGHDTAHLARCVGSEGRVLGLDIQDAALTETYRLLEAEGLCDQVRLFLEDHRDLARLIRTQLGVRQPRLRAVMFNLGYLPGGDESVTTKAETTVIGLEAALAALPRDGVITVVLYSGHEQGPEEVETVLNWARDEVPQRIARTWHFSPWNAQSPPSLLVITRERSIGVDSFIDEHADPS